MFSLPSVRLVLDRLTAPPILFDAWQWLRHLLAWLAAVVLMSWVSWNYVTDGGYDVTAHSSLLASWYGAGNVVIQVACYYWITSLLIPVVLNRRWLKVVGHLLIIYVVSTLGRYYLQIALGHYLAGYSQRFDQATLSFARRGPGLILVNLMHFFDTWIYTYSIILAPLCVKVIRDIYQSRNRALALELNLLRSQINPHFIFNTLNNIYSIVEEKDPYAGELLLKFGGILRHTFYDTDWDVIPLKEELNSLSDYVELEKLRQNYSLPVELDLSAVDEAYFVPPLLLISLVENAFKHGINSTINEGWVSVRLRTTRSELFFEVRNSQPARNQAMPTPRLVHVHRVGLTNVKRRLELLYPRTHQLVITDLPDTYSVTLTLTNDGTPANLPFSRRRAAGPTTA